MIEEKIKTQMKIKLRHLIVACLSITLVNCKSEKKNNHIKVQSFGNRQLILNENELGGVVKIDTLFSGEALFAIGPVEGLQGEVTVYNDLVSIAGIREDKPIISECKNTKAIFLISSNENDWVEYKIERELVGLDEVELYVKEFFFAKKRDFSMAIPFRIETKVSELQYHIIFKKDSLRHNKKEHQKAKIKFNLKDTDINIIGFWVDEERVGRLTHPGKRTHLHFISKDNTTSGHIDNIIIPNGSKIYFPKI